MSGALSGSVEVGDASIGGGQMDLFLQSGLQFRVPGDPLINVSSAPLASDDIGVAYVGITYFARFNSGVVVSALGEGAAIAALSPSGAVMWMRNFTGGRSLIRGIDASANTGVCVAGTARRGFPLISDPDASGPPAESAFISCFEAAGSIRWTRTSSRCASDAWAVSIGSDGTVYAAGEFSGCVDFGIEPEPTGNTGGLFVVAFGSDGSPHWVREFAIPPTDIGLLGDQSIGIAAASRGGVYVVGTINGPVTIGDLQVDPGHHLGGVFLFALSGQGDLIWTRSVFGAQVEAGGVASQATGGVSIGLNATPAAGAPRGIDIGSGWVTGAGGFVATYAADGTPCSAIALNSNTESTGEVGVVGIMRTADDELRAFGRFTGTVDLGDGDVSTTAGVGFVQAIHRD